MSFIYPYIRSICIFCLLTTIILNMFPEEKSKKYIKLLAGFLMIAIVISPITKIKRLDLKIDKMIEKYCDIKPDIVFEKRLKEMETSLYEGVSKYYNQNKEDN